MKQQKYNLLDEKLLKAIDYITGELDFLMNKESVVITKEDEKKLTNFTFNIDTWLESCWRTLDEKEESGII